MFGDILPPESIKLDISRYIYTTNITSLQYTNYLAGAKLLHCKNRNRDQYSNVEQHTPNSHGLSHSKAYIVANDVTVYEHRDQF